MRIKDEKPAVIVFAYDIIPEDIIGKVPAEGMIRKYLEQRREDRLVGGHPPIFIHGMETEITVLIKRSAKNYWEYILFLQKNRAISTAKPPRKV